MNQDISTLHQWDTPSSTYKNMVIQCVESINESTNITWYDYIWFIDWKKVIEIGSIHELTPEELYQEYERWEQEKIERNERLKKQNQLALKEKAKLMRVLGYDFYGTKNYDTIDLSAERNLYPDIDMFLDSMVLAVMEWEGLTYEEALEKHFILDDEAKKHIKRWDIEWISMNQEELAEKVGDLYYDALAAVLSRLADVLKKDHIKYTELWEWDGSPENQSTIDKISLLTSENLAKASNHILNAWEICKPFIKPPLNPKHTSDIQGIPNAELGERIWKLNYWKLAEFLKLLWEKIHRDWLADESRWRKKLATELFEAAKGISVSSDILQ